MRLNDHMPTVALSFLKKGQKVALATVIETWGSAARPSGSQLVIAEDGTFFGSVSGGCVESAVVIEAQEALKDGISRLLDYGVQDEDAFAVGLACGGKIKIAVEPIEVGNGPSRLLMQSLVDAFNARKPIAYKLNLATWERSLGEPKNGDDSERFLADKSGVDGEVFTGIYNPPLRLMIVGAVHIAQHLSAIAQLAGYEVLLVDPREGFSSKARFPENEIIDLWPDEAVASILPDARTAVVTLSHDPKIDSPALEAALKSDAFYIGALGSKRTHDKRKTDLSLRGETQDKISKIHGPIGLEIGSKLPAEIAISIMGEMTERLRRPETRR